MGERRGAYRVLVGNIYRTKPLGKLRLQWEDNIEKILKKSFERAWTGLI